VQPRTKQASFARLVASTCSASAHSMSCGHRDSCMGFARPQVVSGICVKQSVIRSWTKTGMDSKPGAPSPWWFDVTQVDPRKQSTTVHATPPVHPSSSRVQHIPLRTALCALAAEWVSVSVPEWRKCSVYYVWMDGAHHPDKQPARQKVVAGHTLISTLSCRARRPPAPHPPP